MKINEKILNIPPYISTAWDNINTIFSDNNNNIIINLNDGSKITIPNLHGEIIEEIFDVHAKFIEKKNSITSTLKFQTPLLNDPLGGLESMSSAMQHNPEQKDAPNLPPDLLKKIAGLAKIFSDETSLEMPKPEQNCNCVYCQIAKALNIGSGINPENLDEAVSEEELKFKLWDIEEIDEKLFTITNPLDSNEHYNVYLGNPIGCTCGKKDCEHIKAVLNS